MGHILKQNAHSHLLSLWREKKNLVSSVRLSSYAGHHLLVSPYLQKSSHGQERHLKANKDQGKLGYAASIDLRSSTHKNSPNVKMYLPYQVWLNKTAWYELRAYLKRKTLFVTQWAGYYFISNLENKANVYIVFEVEWLKRSIIWAH